MVIYSSFTEHVEKNLDNLWLDQFATMKQCPCVIIRNAWILHFWCRFPYYYHILAVIRASLINRSWAKIGGALISLCVFPQRYTKFETQTNPKLGDALIVEGARMTTRIRYKRTMLANDRSNCNYRDCLNANTNKTAALTKITSSVEVLMRALL